MGRALTREEFAEFLRTFKYTAFRLEIQSAYAVPYEREFLARFNANNPEPADTVPELRNWFDQVREQIRHGKRIGRVRVQDEPPTQYQRIERWADPWNTEAGEDVRYLTRRRAYEIGLLPAAGNHDWWLLDSCALLVMTFGSDHSVIHRELVTDPTRVVQAATWRDLAVHHSVPSEIRHAAV